jgi:tetratricopeptide (TPR) repeat protein
MHVTRAEVASKESVHTYKRLYRKELVATAVPPMRHTIRGLSMTFFFFETTRPGRRVLCGWALAIFVPIAYAASPASSSDPAAPPPYRAPYLPADDAEMLQEVPAASDPHVRQVRVLRGNLDKDPANLATADELAQAYIDFGRQLGDAHYAGYAEAVLGPWLAKPTPPAAVLVDYATILQYRHQFAEARTQLKRALAIQPGNAQAWLTLATLDMVQGDYPTATNSCSQVAVNGGFQLGIACVANLRSYLGQAQQSLTLLGQLEGDRPGLAPVYKAWVQGLLAEVCERLGDWPQAETHYRKALSFTPEDNFLLVAYADFLLDRNRPAEVLTLLRNSSQSDTGFLRLALAKAALHSPDLPLYTWIMGARFAALVQRGSDYFGREQVRFALYLQHNAPDALDLAQRNWAIQRAPWDARVLLEAALAAHQPRAATPVLQFIHDTKLQDPIIEALARQLEAQLDSGKGKTP